MKQVYFSNSIGEDRIFGPFLTITVQANEAREICIQMKQIFPEMSFAFSSINTDGWDFKV
jgi:hypothetical protein